MTIAFLMALSVSAAAPQAAPPRAAAAVEVNVDARWAPWLGCWRLEGPTAQAGTRVCLVPGGAGVRRVTIADGTIVEEQVIVPDGTARPLQSTDCQGKETAQWLSRESRLVRSAELSCGSDGSHTVAGVAFLVRGPVWIDAQTVDKAGKRGVRIQRFRRAADQQLPAGVVSSPAARQLPSSSASTDVPWTVDDVIEASGKLPPEVLQAALSESNTGFPLSGKALIRLADAGVSEDIIDLMVALSNPKRFQVHRADGTAPGWAETYEGWPGLEDSFSITMRYAGMAFPGFYDPLGYWADCGFFGSCGGFYPYYDYAYWGGGGWVEVDPGPPVGGGGGGAPQSHGKVINGLGYTQVSVRPDPAVARIGSGGSGGSSGSSSSGSSGTSGSSGASPGGYSSGGGGGGERTAVPRGPGND